MFLVIPTSNCKKITQRELTQVDPRRELTHTAEPSCWVVFLYSTYIPLKRQVVFGQ